MFLSLFTDRERDLFYTLSLHLIESDGIITGEEKTMLEGFKLESGRKLERIHGTPNEIISELSLSSNKIKNCILLELIYVALSDNNYTENERSIISKVVSEFDICDSKFREIFDWVTNLKGMYSKILELVNVR